MWLSGVTSINLFSAQYNNAYDKLTLRLSFVNLEFYYFIFTILVFVKSADS